MAHDPSPIRAADLIEIRQYLDSIIENIPNMIFVKDAADLRFVLFNRAGEELLGRAREDLLGKNDYDFFPQKQADFFTAKDRQVLESGKVLDIPEEPIETPRGRRWLHTKKVPLLGADGTPRYLLGISEDITDRRAAERMKSDLISVASHELRSPAAAMLAAIRAFADMVGTGLDPDACEMLELATANGERMLTVLNNCLDIGRLEADRVRLYVQDVGLPGLLDEAVRLNQPFADDYQVEFQIGDFVEPAIARADPARLMQVLTNLMTNAAKFSPEGADVTLSLRACKGGFRILVLDRGPGIPESFQEHVFQKFSRSRTLETGQNEGSGLGLSIARELVERMGGQIGFETEQGVGTTFYIDLPRA